MTEGEDGRIWGNNDDGWSDGHLQLEEIQFETFRQVSDRPM